MPSEKNNTTEEETETKDDAKEIIRFATIFDIWAKSQIELDRSLLNLSAGGIGLLVTMLTITDILTSCAAMMYFLAGLSFLVCIVCVINGYPRSIDYLGKVISEDKYETVDQITMYLNKTAFISFIFGIVFTLLIGLLLMIENHIK